MTFYYDPIIDYHHMAPVSVAGLFPTFYLSPQEPADARAIYDAGAEQLGLLAEKGTVRLPGPRMSGITIALSREYGEETLANALLDAANGQYEPSWDRVRGEFTQGLRARRGPPARPVQCGDGGR